MSDSKLICTVQATLDGVIDNNQHWVQVDGDHSDHSMEMQEAASALVLGRKTYEGLAGFWAPRGDSDRWAAMVNPKRKFVGSRTLDGELDWNATVIEGDDLASAMQRLKDESDGNLVSHGTGEFVYSLFEAGVADELLVYLNPLTFGQGTHLFEGREPLKLDLAEVTRFDSGVTGLTYVPAS